MIELYRQLTHQRGSNASLPVKLYESASQLMAILDKMILQVKALLAKEERQKQEIQKHANNATLIKKIIDEALIAPLEAQETKKLAAQVEFDKAVFAALEADEAIRLAAQAEEKKIKEFEAAKKESDLTVEASWNEVANSLLGEEKESSERKESAFFSVENDPSLWSPGFEADLQDALIEEKHKDERSAQAQKIEQDRIIQENKIKEEREFLLIQAQNWTTYNKQLFNILFCSENIDLLSRQVRFRQIGGGKKLVAGNKIVAIPTGANELIHLWNSAASLPVLREKAKFDVEGNKLSLGSYSRIL